ncbi:MAG TPA: CRTAC1 family protein [Thermoanaerobaculia bacterium]|nr:CRTAC1 family protein [Thermoanaerobaculia bacterium]
MRFIYGFGALALVATACGGSGPAGCEHAAIDPRVDSLAAMVAAEEATEALERQLIDFAATLAAGESSAVETDSGLFAAAVDGGAWDAAPGEEAPLDDAAASDGWLARRPWSVERTAGSAEPAAAADSFATLTAPFAHLDGVSLSVAAAEWDREGGRLAADVDLDLRGVAADGRREWLRGSARLEALRGEGEEAAWRVEAVCVHDLESLVARRPLFVDVTAAAGAAADDPLLDATTLGTVGWYPNGAAAVDADGDGLLDLFVTGPEENRLYLNDGAGGFRDAAADAGLAALHPSKAEFMPLFFDADNDGDADLFVLSEHQNLYYENRSLPDGGLVFVDASNGVEQMPQVQGWSSTVGDVDGDALPDLYVASYFAPASGPYPVTTVDDVAGSPNVLLMNRGDGIFEEAAARWGVDDRRFATGAQFADYDGDGDLDLYVTNDFGGGNPLFENQGDRFVDRAAELGAELSMESMGISFADYDADGDLDLHVTNMSSRAANRALDRVADLELSQRELLARQWRGNALLENVGEAGFREVSAEAGPFFAEWAWGGGFLDLDNDGRLDLHSPNGFNSGAESYDGRGILFRSIIVGMHEEDAEAKNQAIGQGFAGMGKHLVEDGWSFGGRTHDAVYWNRGDGTFLDVSGVAGGDTFPSSARASVYADFDNDGDLDLFVRATHGRAHFLFRNDLADGSRFLRVALEGRASGRDAWGATVRVSAGGRVVAQAKRGDNGYLAQSDPRLLFGLGAADAAVDWVEVSWPSGAVERFEPPPGADSILVVEGEGARPVEERRFRLGGGGGGGDSGDGGEAAR